MASSPVASLTMVNVDCADPGALATFYAGLLGWRWSTASTTTP